MGETVVARKSGEGPAIWMLGGLYEVKAASEETAGRVTIMEVTIPAGMGPPPHTHPGGEAVYVLEGTISYTIGGRRSRAARGRSSASSRRPTCASS